MFSCKIFTNQRQYLENLGGCRTFAAKYRRIALGKQRTGLRDFRHDHSDCSPNLNLTCVGYWIQTGSFLHVSTTPASCRNLPSWTMIDNSTCLTRAVCGAGWSQRWMRRFHKPRWKSIMACSWRGSLAINIVRDDHAEYTKGISNDWPSNPVTLSGLNLAGASQRSGGHYDLVSENPVILRSTNLAKTKSCQQVWPNFKFMIGFPETPSHFWITRVHQSSKGIWDMNCKVIDYFFQYKLVIGFPETPSHFHVWSKDPRVIGFILKLHKFKNLVFWSDWFFWKTNRNRTRIMVTACLKEPWWWSGSLGQSRRTFWLGAHLLCFGGRWFKRNMKI